MNIKELLEKLRESFGNSIRKKDSLENYLVKNLGFSVGKEEKIYGNKQNLTSHRFDVYSRDGLYLMLEETNWIHPERRAPVDFVKMIAEKRNAEGKVMSIYYFSLDDIDAWTNRLDIPSRKSA